MVWVRVGALAFRGTGSASEDAERLRGLGAGFVGPDHEHLPTGMSREAIEKTGVADHSRFRHGYGSDELILKCRSATMISNLATVTLPNPGRVSA
jgi:hypothetical protein